MTLTLPLTPEEETKLIAITEERGVSPDALVGGVVREILDRSQLASSGGNQPGDGEKSLEEPDIREEAFRRETWCR
jgi:hypothetical protein